MSRAAAGLRNRLSSAGPSDSDDLTLTQTLSFEGSGSVPAEPEGSGPVVLPHDAPRGPLLDGEGVPALLVETHEMIDHRRDPIVIGVEC